MSLGLGAQTKNSTTQTVRQKTWILVRHKKSLLLLDLISNFYVCMKIYYSSKTSKFTGKMKISTKFFVLIVVVLNVIQSYTIITQFPHENTRINNQIPIN